MRRMACVLALATAAGLPCGPAGAAPTTAIASTGLKITVSNPTEVTSGSPLALDVRFTGANLRSVELYIDSHLVTQMPVVTLSGHGKVTLKIDGTYLVTGSHQILVRAYDRLGNPANATTAVEVTEVQANAVAHFAAPSRSQIVQGVLPITVTLDRSIRNPYVSASVDQNFIGLTNYAPFTFNLDTTTLSNGRHTIRAEVYDGETTAMLGAFTTDIIVHNPGGFTMRTPTPPAVGGTMTGDPVYRKAAPAPLRSAAEVAAAATRIDPIAVTPGLAHIARGATAGFGGRAAEPSTHAESWRAPAAHRPSSPSVAAPAVTGLEPAQPALAPDTNRRMAAAPSASTRAALPGLLGALATPSSLAGLPVSAEGALARITAGPRHSGNIAVRPPAILGVGAVADRLTHHSTPAAATTARAPQAPAGHSHGAFDVAFDDTQIAFDVPPRVENGLPLAPFRQIFEHTGGLVQWFGRSRTVRAISATREIEFRIGEAHALLNNRPLAIERAPYLDGGRTIVPLSFIRDALDVTVQYDPVNGHLRIESRK